MLPRICYSSIACLCQVTAANMQGTKSLTTLAGSGFLTFNIVGCSSLWAFCYITNSSTSAVESVEMQLHTIAASVYTYRYICIYSIYIYRCAYVYICTNCMFVLYVYASVCVCIHIYIYLYTYVYRHIHILVCVCIYNIIYIT